MRKTNSTKKNDARGRDNAENTWGKGLFSF